MHKSDGKFTKRMVAFVFCLTLQFLLHLSACSRTETSGSSSASRNLRAIADALLRFQVVKGRFPPVRTVDVNDKPMHSWRVFLVPFLESNCFFDAYDLNHPWNEGSNTELLSEFRIDLDDGTSRDCADVRKFFCGNGSAGRSELATSITMLELTDGQVEKSTNVQEHTTVVLIAWKKSSMHWMNPADYTMEDIRSAAADCNVESIEAIVVFSKSRTTYKLIESDDAVEFARNAFIRGLNSRS